MNPANEETELLMMHGDIDEVVLHDWGKSSYDLIKSSGNMEGEFLTFNGILREP